jgi:poly-beta-hydroxybutyrate-responsive repressor
LWRVGQRASIHPSQASTTAWAGEAFMSVPEPRNFLQPCLLLLLRERADHGYELVSRLGPMHVGESDSGGVYRALRGLENRGLVRSEWSTSGSGPARRTYHLTSDGSAHLDAQVAELQQMHGVLHRFLDRYSRCTDGTSRAATPVAR